MYKLILTLLAAVATVAAVLCILDKKERAARHRPLVEDFRYR